MLTSSHTWIPPLSPFSQALPVHFHMDLPQTEPFLTKTKKPVGYAELRLVNIEVNNWVVEL